MIQSNSITVWYHSPRDRERQRLGVVARDEPRGHHVVAPRLVVVTRSSNSTYESDQTYEHNYKYKHTHT